jgi:hypothetical protein
LNRSTLLQKRHKEPLSETPFENIRPSGNRHNTYLMNIKSTFLAFLLAGATAHATVLTFPDVATLISGGSEQVGAQYRYSNVGTISGSGGSFDAILTLSAEANGASFSFGEPRDTLIGVGQDGRFRIEPTFTSESPAGSFTYVEFNLRFVESGSLNSVIGESVSLVVNDIDSQGTSDFSDVFGIQSSMGGTFTLSSDTNLVNSITVGTEDTYRTFSLDTGTDLTSAPGISTDPVNFSQNQSDYSVQFDIESVGGSGINFLWGMQEGAGPVGHDHENNRTVLIDGTGTFVFDGETVVENIPEPTVFFLGALATPALLLRRRR